MYDSPLGSLRALFSLFLLVELEVLYYHIPLPPFKVYI